MLEIAEKLKDDAEKLVSEIGQGTDHKALHPIALDVLMRSVELIRYFEGSGQEKASPRKAKTTDLSESDEVKKVSHRLKLWANRPHQINHIILRKWLELNKEKGDSVTEAMLEKAVLDVGLEGGSGSFHSNFSQMKVIAEKNHGKVFDVSNGIVNLWQPVEEAVFEFKSKVLS